MTCGVAARRRLYARALATMRAYRSAEWSSFTANAEDSAARRAVPACSTPSHAKTPTPNRQQATVTATRARNTRRARRACRRRTRRPRRPSVARSPSMIQSQSITSMPSPRSIPRISGRTGKAGVQAITPHPVGVVDGRPPALPSSVPGHSPSGMPWPFIRLVSMTVDPTPITSRPIPPAISSGRLIPPVSTKFS